MVLEGLRAAIVGLEGLHLAVAGDVHHLQQVGAASRAEVTKPARERVAGEGLRVEACSLGVALYDVSD